MIGNQQGIGAVIESDAGWLDERNRAVGGASESLLFGGLSSLPVNVKNGVGADRQ